MPTYVKLNCDSCEIEFLRKKGIHNTNLIREHKTKFCSRACMVTFFAEKKPEVSCKNCNKKFRKKIAQVRLTKNNFCTKSCAVTYNNMNKTRGTRRSKLEKWLEEKLAKIYDFTILFNQKTTIGSELDIYIPSLNIAIEINGIFHYEPIYGVEKFNQIKNNDIKKAQKCFDAGIELFTIDASDLKYFKETNCIKYLETINEIINNALPRFELGTTRSKDERSAN
jgi:hypothetical protein